MSLPPQLASLHPAIVDDVTEGLAVRVADVVPPRATALTVASAGWTAVIENVVRTLLNAAADTFGPGLTADVLAHRESIRKVIGENVLEMFDGVIHGLEDVKTQAQQAGGGGA